MRFILTAFKSETTLCLSHICVVTFD